MINEAVQFDINGTIVEVHDSAARELVGSKYTLPQGGIPMADLSDEVKAGMHNTLPSSAVTSMADYQIASSGSSISTGDTLNQAIGKLEKMVAVLQQIVTDNELVTAAALTELEEKLK